MVDDFEIRSHITYNMSTKKGTRRSVWRRIWDGQTEAALIYVGRTSFRMLWTYSGAIFLEALAWVLEAVHFSRFFITAFHLAAYSILILELANHVARAGITAYRDIKHRWKDDG